MRRNDTRAVGTATASIGAVIAATLAAACCTGPLLGPLIVTSIGVSGATALAGLKPYSPYLFGASLAMLAFSFWSVYRRAVRCAIGTEVNGTSEPITVKTLLWVAAGVWLTAVVFTLFSLGKL